VFLAARTWQSQDSRSLKWRSQDSSYASASENLGFAKFEPPKNAAEIKAAQISGTDVDCNCIAYGEGNMQKYDAWLKIKNKGGAVEKVLRLIHDCEFTVSNLRLSRSLDRAFYHINIEMEGPGYKKLSEQIAVLSDVDKAEFRDHGGPEAVPSLADVSG
jgi:acetolactate synthase regulatory subunit